MVKARIAASVCGLVLAASLLVSIVGTIYGTTDPSTGKYERLQGNSIYEAGFLFVCPFH